MKKMTRTAARAAAISALALVAGACAPTSIDSAEMKAEQTQDATMASTEQSVIVGGAAMLPSRNIVENAVNSRDHTTLVAAVQAAGLAETLSGPGPFTVFAPTISAFAKLPDGAVDSLLEPANKDALTGVLTYHVVPGRLTAGELVAQAQANDGSATLTTVQGATLTVTPSASGVTVTDAGGGTSTVTIADVLQSNGIIHVIDTVLMPPG